MWHCQVEKCSPTGRSEKIGEDFATEQHGSISLCVHMSANPVCDQTVGISHKSLSKKSRSVSLQKLNDKLVPFVK